MNTLPDCRARYQKLRPRKDLQSLSTILFPESESGIDIIQVREDIISARARNVCLLQLCTTKTLPRTNIHWGVISPVCGNNVSSVINWRSAVRSTEVASPKLTTTGISSSGPITRTFDNALQFWYGSPQETVELLRRTVADNTDKSFYQFNLQGKQNDVACSCSWHAGLSQPLQAISSSF
jgi:hypothetical protein